MPEVIQDGKNGFLVPPGDSQALANRIILLLNDKVCLKQLGENAYNFVKDNFLWEKVVGRIEQSLKNVA
jgi:glycosyltransferase involved in cell wall biosynthesis